MKILLATSNKDKQEELKKGLSELNFEITTLEDLNKNFEAPEEIYDTLEGNAMLKAKYYGDITGLPALSDDSGLFIHSLGGWPGINSARVAENGPKRREAVLEKMIGMDDRSAVFKAVLVFYDPTARTMHLEFGDSPGKILKEPMPAPENAFQYDPIFWSKELGRTFSELNMEEKNSVSHRGKALKKMRNFLQFYINQ